MHATRPARPAPGAHSRPRLLTAVAALLALASLLLAACGGESTPTSSDLLKKAHDQWAATNSLHFNMTVDHPGSGSINNPYPTSAQGDVKRPDAMSAVAGVDVGLANLNVNLIIIGSNEWWSAPGLTTGFQATDDYGSFLKIFDPNVGLGALLLDLRNPSKPADGSANGTPCYKISGTLAPDTLKPIFGDLTATDPVPTTFCIGKSDGKLYSAALSGQLMAGDKAQTVHTFYLSKFDETITVTPPAGS